MATTLNIQAASLTSVHELSDAVFISTTYLLTGDPPSNLGGTQTRLALWYVKSSTFTPCGPSGGSASRKDLANKTTHKKILANQKFDKDLHK